MAYIHTETHIYAIKNKTNRNKIKKMSINQTTSLPCWCTPVTLGVGMTRQEGQKSGAGHGYKASLRPAKATWDSDIHTKIMIMS